MRRGKIENFKGTHQSGIAQITIKDSKTGISMEIPCDNAPTVRMFAHLYDNVIGAGHTVNVDAIKGREIYWQFDDMGLIFGGFTPVETAPVEWEKDWLAFCKENQDNKEEEFEVTGL